MFVSWTVTFVEVGCIYTISINQRIKRIKNLNFFWFLAAITQLYKDLCPSLPPSLTPSLPPSIPPCLLQYDDSESWMKWPSSRLLPLFLAVAGVKEKKTKRQKEGVRIFIENIFHRTLWTRGSRGRCLFNESHLVSILLSIDIDRSWTSVWMFAWLQLWFLHWASVCKFGWILCKLCCLDVTWDRIWIMSK